MIRAERRAAGDFTALVEVPEGMGDEPRMRLSQHTIDHCAQTPDGPNLYRCTSCGDVTLTVHRHAGVTPMYLPCGMGHGCGGQAESAFYPAPPLPAETAALPVWEWYRPSLPEFQDVSRAYRDHVESGGLLIRRHDGLLPAQVREETNDEKRARVGALFGGAR